MLHQVPHSAFDALYALAARSAAPERVALALSRLGAELPDQLDSMLERGEPNEPPRAFVAVVAASDSLGRFCITEPRAHDVLADLDHKATPEWVDGHSLALVHRLDMLRIAARDLLGRDSFDEVTRALSESAARVLEASVELAGSGNGEIAVIGMGKLGGSELELRERRRLRVRDGAFARRRQGKTDRGRGETLVSSGHRPATRRQGGSAHSDTRRVYGLLGPVGTDLGVPGSHKGTPGGRGSGARGNVLGRRTDTRMGPVLQRRRARADQEAEGAVRSHGGEPGDG